MGKKQISLAPALVKGMEVLELLSQSSSSMNLTEMARRLNRSVSEIQRTVGTLHHLHYLIRNDLGGYTMSPKLFRLAHIYPPFHTLAELSRSAMDRFAHLTRESVHLSVLHQNRLLLLAQVEGVARGRFSMQTGTQEDLSRTVSGRILLSFENDKRAESLLDLEEASSEERRNLNVAMNQVRESGYHHAASSVFEGVWDLGVPILDSEGGALASLTTSWVRKRVDPQTMERLLPCLQAARESIEGHFRHNMD